MVRFYLPASKRSQPLSNLARIARQCGGELSSHPSITTLVWHSVPAA